MSTQPPLGHVPPPDWFGTGLVNLRAGGNTADALATGSDVGGLAAEADPVMESGDAFNAYGGVGTALSQYDRSLLDEAYFYGGSSAWRECGRLVETSAAVLADYALGAIEVLNTGGVLPVLDAFLKSVASQLRISIADTMLDGIRAIAVGLVGRPEDKARLRARARMGGMSRAADLIVALYDDPLSARIQRVAEQLRGELDEEPED